MMPYVSVRTSTFITPLSAAAPPGVRSLISNGPDVVFFGRRNRNPTDPLSARLMETVDMLLELLQRLRWEQGGTVRDSGLVDDHR